MMAFDALQADEADLADAVRSRVRGQRDTWRELDEYTDAMDEDEREAVAMGYWPLDGGLYVDLGSGTITEAYAAGRTEPVSDHPSIEQRSLDTLEEYGRVHEGRFRDELKDRLWMDLDIDRAVAALRERDDVVYTGGDGPRDYGVLELQYAPEPADDTAVIQLLEEPDQLDADQVIEELEEG